MKVEFMSNPRSFSLLLIGIITNSGLLSVQSWPLVYGTTSLSWNDQIMPIKILIWKFGLDMSQRTTKFPSTLKISLSNISIYIVCLRSRRHSKQCATLYERGTVSVQIS
jgi:hypothetical protein